MEINQYLEIFLEESKEHLQLLNEKLLLLENDNKNLGLISEVFRSAHTLKGMAATMGFEKMATLTHEMENLLDLIRTNKRIVDSSVMDTIFNSVDLLEQMVVTIGNGGDDNLDISLLIKQLEDLASEKPVNSFKHDPGNNNLNSSVQYISFDEYERTVLQQSLSSGFDVYQILVTVEKETVLKSARAFMVFHDLEKHGEVLKSIPTVEELENENFDNTFTVVLVSKDNEEDIKNSILNISEIEEAIVTRILENDLKIEAKIKDDNSPLGVKSENKEVQQQVNNTHYGKTIRVDIDRLDELMNLFSELVIDRGRLEQLANDIKHPGLTDTVEHMNRISSSLQNNILNLRMVPIEQVFNRFPRMVRDLSKELNKKVNLNIFGADTELDRTVIDEIGDPLVHLLRNAVDHGQETTGERIKNNKPEVGEINLTAYHSGNYVFIEVSDDGKGIDRNKILKKAVEKETLTQETANNLTDKQIFDLLFTSGFSTAQQVSDISGRGVGLDVVKSKIEALGGFVTVDSIYGKGTKFIIQLPLTLSIISSMLVKIQEEKYAIPLSSIIETAIINKEDIMNAHNQDVIDFRGHIVPLIYLNKIFEVPSAYQGEETEVSVVLVRKGDKMAGLVIDSFIGQQEIVLKSLGSYLTNVFSISGATILGDGQVALIIDTNALIK